MKKYLTILIIVLTILAILVGGAFVVFKSKKPVEENNLTMTEGILIETSLRERPFVSLTPSIDGHWLTINVSEVKDASTLEYEMLYNTVSGANQGSINQVVLEGETFYSKKILLGSESSGHYKYDEGVTEGNLTVRLRGGEGTRKFVTDFHLQNGDKTLTSKDGRFQVTGNFSPATYYLTMATVGLPANSEGQVIAGPYGVFTSGSQMIKNGVVSLTLTEEKSAIRLYFWNGKAWQEIENFQINGKTVTATIEQLATYLVVASE